MTRRDRRRAQAQARHERDPVTKVTRDLVDGGKLVETGWLGYRTAVISPRAPDVQVRECRMAFFAGAQHVYASLMTMLEPGEDPTTADLGRMQALDDELRRFADDFALNQTPTEGSA
jgi:hypothetical protein